PLLVIEPLVDVRSWWTTHQTVAPALRRDLRPHEVAVAHGDRHFFRVLRAITNLQSFLQVQTSGEQKGIRPGSLFPDFQAEWARAERAAPEAGAVPLRS